MSEMLRPKSQREERVFATERLRSDLQHVIIIVMREKGVTRKQLAKTLRCSLSNISQLLAEDGNPTLETMSKIFYALGDELYLSSKSYDHWRTSEEAKNVWISSHPVYDENISAASLPKWFHYKNSVPRRSRKVTSSRSVQSFLSWSGVTGPDVVEMTSFDDVSIEKLNKVVAA